MLKKSYTFEYDDLDDNGFPKFEIKINPQTGKSERVPKEKLTAELRFDSGDQNFAGSIDRIATNELAKIQAAASEVPEIANTRLKLKVNGNNRVIDSTTNQPIDSRSIYAEFANKFKDAMVDPKSAYQNTKEYAEAHAYKDGIGNSGSKK